MTKKYLLQSALLAIGLIILLEILIRVLGIATIQRTRGWGHNFACCGDLRPNKDILSLVSETHPYLVETNNLGLRNTYDVTREKDDDTYRILAIGDSFTFGPYVPNEATWPATLETFLQEAEPKKHIEVLNAGIASYTISDELNYLSEKGLFLNPDLIVLNVTFNDIADLRKNQRGYFARPNLQQDRYARMKQTIKSFLYDHSHFVSLLVQVKNDLLKKQIKSDQTEMDDATLYNDIIYGDETELQKTYEEYFSEFVGILKQKNIPLIVLYFPNTQMVIDANTQTPQLFKTTRFIQNLSEKMQVPIFDATTILTSYPTTLTYLLPWNGHPSTTGYHLTSQALSEFIINLQLQKPTYDIQKQ